MAETEGFEPSIPFSRYAHLANECLQPLGHISCNIRICPTRWLPQAAFSGKAAVWRRAAILALQRSLTVKNEFRDGGCQFDELSGQSLDASLNMRVASGLFFLSSANSPL